MTAPSNANTSGLAPTDALRLVPSRITPEMAHALESNFAECIPPSPIHAANWQEAWTKCLAAAPASPLPGGGPYERWSILNHLGESWTPENFNTERQATAYLDGWKRDNPKMDLSKHKVIPVLVTMTAAPTGEPK